MARGHHGHHHRRGHAAGGVPKSDEPSSGSKNVHKSNPDLPVFKEAADKSDGFKRGGHRKHGGKVDGKHPHHRADKRARGGRAMASGHRGVLSSAHATSAARVGSEND